MILNDIVNTLCGAAFAAGINPCISKSSMKRSGKIASSFILFPPLCNILLSPCVVFLPSALIRLYCSGLARYKPMLYVSCAYLVVGLSLGSNACSNACSKFTKLVPPTTDTVSALSSLLVVRPLSKTPSVNGFKLPSSATSSRISTVSAFPSTTVSPGGDPK